MTSGFGNGREDGEHTCVDFVGVSKIFAMQNESFFGTPSFDRVLVRMIQQNKIRQILWFLSSKDNIVYIFVLEKNIYSRLTTRHKIVALCNTKTVSRSSNHICFVQ